MEQALRLKELEAVKGFIAVDLEIEAIEAQLEERKAVLKVLEDRVQRYFLTEGIPSQRIGDRLVYTHTRSFLAYTEGTTRELATQVLATIPDLSYLVSPNFNHNKLNADVKEIEQQAKMSIFEKYPKLRAVFKADEAVMIKAKKSEAKKVPTRPARSAEKEDRDAEFAEYTHGK